MTLHAQTDSIAFDLVAEGLSFPTSLAFDDQGVLYVAESGLPWDGEAPGGKIWRVLPRGDRQLHAQDLRHPVNGITWHQGLLYVSEGGSPGRISRILPGGERQTVLEGLPGPGNYHTNMAVFGPDGKLYFSQGAMSNSAIVGLDAYDLGWLRQLPHQHDLPGLDIELAGFDVTTPDPLAEDGAKATTGAFVPFGTPTHEGQRIEAELPCTAAVMRCNSDGSGLELVAWGLRNAYGLGFISDGTLLAVDQGADERGSRPIGSAPDLLFRVRAGDWYGWPDFIGGEPVTDPKYRPRKGPQLQFVLSNHHELPAPQPALLRFPPHCGALKFDQIPEGGSRWPGHLLVALFGDEVPMTAPEGPRAGRCLARVDPTDWSLHRLPALPLHRPIEVRFAPGEPCPYVLDFGFFEMEAGAALNARAKSGRILRLAGF
ncbi:MAG TPA: sugar dehydrogenase [Acidobacteriota bacterium]|nr:sugar dehydrogenase [Acidobacteriota bacterium]